MAWTGNFKTQIGDLSGVLATPDDAAIQQWILDGCYDVLSKAIVKHGEDEVWKFVAKSGDVTTVDTDVDENRTISAVVRNSVYAVKGKWQFKNKYADANSIYAATANSPVWYISDSTLSIYPAPAGGSAAQYYYVPEYALTSWDGGTSSINDYPSEYYYYAMLYAAVQVLHRRMLDSTVPTSPTFEALPVGPDALTDLVISATPPTIVGDPTIAYVGTAVPGVADITGNVPAYNKPSTLVTAVTPDAPSLATITYTGPTTSDVTTAPTVATTAYVLPSAGTAFSSRLVDFSALTSFSIIAVTPDEIPVPNITSPTVDPVTLADITGSLPVYDTQTVIDGTLGNITAQTIDNLSITAVPPDQFTPQLVTYTPPTAAIASAPSGITDIIGIDDADVTSITEASSGQPTYLPPVPPDSVALSVELDKMKEYIEDEEDNELSAAKGQEISQRLADFNASLSQYQAELGEANAVYQKDAAIYQALVQQATQNANVINSHEVQNMQKELQREQSVVQTGSTEHATALQIEQGNTANEQAKVMQDAIQTVQAIIADNTAKMQEWSQGLAHYQAEVGTEVQEFSNNLTKTTQLWQQTNTIILQEHSQRMQNELNNFNEGNARYQANVQAQMAKFQADAADASKEADLEIQASIQDYTFELQKWSQSLSQYQAEVNTEVQEFTQKLQLEMQSWTAEQANAIQQYQMETADNMKTADIANQAALQQAQADLQVAVRDKDKQLEREIQNATNDMQKISQDNQSKISNYQAELAVYQAEVGAEMQVIGADIQNELNAFNKENALYQASTSATIAKFQADVDDAKQTGDMTLQAAIQDYTLELQAFQSEVTLYQAEVADAVQEYSTNLQKYQAELSAYGAELAVYQADSASKLQKYQADLQAEGVGYQWLQDQYGRLKMEYEKAFAVAQPQAQA